VIRSSGRFFFLLVLLLLSVNAEAGNADYRRARALAESDPMEAEALYEKFLRETSNRKLRRAANYELFFLRLRNARLVEAFAQSANKDFDRKFRTAVADAYSISEAQASGLVRRLRAVCANEKDVSRLGDYLRRQEMSAPVWDFALRVMLRCGVQGRSQIFAADLFELERPTRLQTALRLIAVREQLFVDPERASELFAITRTAAQEQYAADEQLHVQLFLLEARIAALQEDYDSAIALCNALATEEKAKPVKSACDLLVAHALLQQGDAANAWKRIRRVPVKPIDMDTRLLRLTVAVAAGREKPEELVRFSKRASYAYCARSLRELAESVLAQKKSK
jgi:hypothetical protein